MPNMRKLAITAAALLSLTGGSAVHAAYAPPQLNTYGQGGWNVPPREYRQYARKGYLDGIEGARRDVENHRRPNVTNRDEFRHPGVPGQFHREYRMGFRRGYNVLMQHLLNGPR